LHKDKRRVITLLENISKIAVNSLQVDNNEHVIKEFIILYFNKMISQIKQRIEIMILCENFRDVEADLLEFENDVKTFEKSEVLKHLKKASILISEEVSLGYLPKLN
jgi:hypothetical protein